MICEQCGEEYKAAYHERCPICNASLFEKHTCIECEKIIYVAMLEDPGSEIEVICTECVANRLINKLQVLNNNIGMANVCSVPLSYLFLRGQGIKGTSLVAKKCNLITTHPDTHVRFSQQQEYVYPWLPWQ